MTTDTALTADDHNLVWIDLEMTGLDPQLKRAQGQPQELPQEALAERCRSNPQILNLLAPFLPDELVKRLMDEVKDDPNDQA